MKILSKIALFIPHARFNRRRKRYLRTFVLKSECKGNANPNKHQNFFKENSKLNQLFRFVQQNREKLRGTSTLNLYPNRTKETILSSLPTLLYIKGSSWYIKESSHHQSTNLSSNSLPIAIITKRNPTKVMLFTLQSHPLYDIISIILPSKLPLF